MEEELKKLKNLFEKGLISKEVYDIKQSEVMLDFEKNIKIQDSTEMFSVKDNEEVLMSLSGSHYFDDDLIGHNNLLEVTDRTFHLARKWNSKAMVAKDEIQIRPVTEIYTVIDYLKESDLVEKIIIVPEQNIKKLSDIPSIKTIVESTGSFDKKFKKGKDGEEYEVNNFILVIPVHKIDKINISEVDTSEISGFKNLVGTWTGANISPRKHFENYRVIDVYGNGFFKSETEDFKEVSFKFRTMSNLLKTLDEDVFITLFGNKAHHDKSNKIRLSDIKNLMPKDIMNRSGFLDFS